MNHTGPGGTNTPLDAVLNLSTHHRGHEEFYASAPRELAVTRRSAAELVSRAADLSSDSAGLVNDNERRWRVFHDRMASIVERHRSADPSGTIGPGPVPRTDAA